MTVLRALICEDSPDDADLLRRTLTRGGYEVNWVRVQTADTMQAALDECEWDVVFSDWNMPQFGALAALDVLHASEKDLPFIIVSGTVAEDVAVTALRCGAHDFFSKDKLVRLVSAVEREMREKEVRRERTQMREQLMISDRMASVGILASGVGHEINNPLASVIGNLQLALDALPELVHAADAGRLVALEECLRDAHVSAERIRDVATDLRLFARADGDGCANVDVIAVVESSLRMARTELRHRSQVVTDLEPVPPVAANESRLGQVLLNLIVNAAQSIPEGNVDENEIKVSTRCTENGHVVIEVRDTGSGMTAEVRKRLFTPFFTTKDPGTGTGLGLSICHRIITSFGGTISVDSEVGRGSVFRVHLPSTIERAGGPETDARDAPDVGGSTRGKVLSVDDEPSVRVLVRRVLGAAHEVSSAATATEALEMIAGGARFDVILCDLMMPQVDGMSFYEELSTIAPELTPRVAFVTGGAFTERARDFLKHIENSVIEKPFDIKALRRFVDEQVASHSA